MSHPKKTLYTDYCVIGGGSGGLSFAAGAAQMGLDVVLLEEKKMGGDCLNSGCVPSKALLACARGKETLHRMQSMGWMMDETKDVPLDFTKAMAHVHQTIKTIEPHDSMERFQSLGVKVFLERGSFVDGQTVETPTHRIQAKRFIVATGSHPFVPPIPGLDQIPYHTNETIFHLKERPEHLVVIGGGPIGIEMAQAFRHLGSRVTVIEAVQVLPKDDASMVARLKNILRDQGVVLLEKTGVQKVQKHKNGVTVITQSGDGPETAITASHLLVATGRRPNLTRLDLDKAGISHGPQGIHVNERLQTINPKVFAIGDCAGGFQFTHVAGFQAGLALMNSLFRLRGRKSRRVIPWVTYTHPELAHVGALETDLQKARRTYGVYEMSFEENDRAQAEKQTQGWIKILCTSRGRILGATILGHGAGDLIYPWVMAMQNGMKLHQVVQTIAPYPTFSDMHVRVAGKFFQEKISGCFGKKIVGLFRKFL